jgi:DNA-binding transcriptional LysR family regulator
MINYNYLPVFKSLFNTLSFSETARELRMAQPAVSRSIKALEQQLGHQLFLRTNKMVTPTEIGKGFYQKISGAVAEIEEQCQAVVFENEEVKGKIRIGSLRELGENKLGDVFSKFCTRFPSVEVEIIYAGNRELSEKIREGELDFYFGLDAIENENIRAFKLFHQASSLVTSKKTKVPKQFNPKEVKYIGYRYNDPLIQSYFSSFFPKHTISKLDQVFTVNSHKTMIEILSNNENLYAVVPAFSDAIEIAMKKGLIKKVRNQSLKADCYFAYWEKQFRSQAEVEFIRMTKTLKK